MKLFKSDIEILRRASPSKPFRRFLSTCIDFLLVLLIGYGLFSASYSILENNDTYISQVNKTKEEITYYNAMIDETHLVEFQDEEKTIRYSTDYMAIINVSRQILLSYNTNHASFTEEPTFNDYDIEEASYLTDNVAYFYTQYVPLNNDNDSILSFGAYTPEQYYTKVLQNAFSDNQIMFNFSETEFPYLNGTVANYIYQYLYKNNDASGKGNTYYETFYYGYSSMLSDAEDLVISSEPYNSEHYIYYKESITAQANMIVYAVMISFVVAYLLGVLLPQLILRDGVTIGRLILRLGVISNQRIEVSPLSVVFRTILGIFGFWITAIMIPLLPPFDFNFDIYYMPLTKIGNYGISFFLIISIIGLLIGLNGIVMLLTHSSASLEDLLSKSIVVDKKHLDEVEVDAPMENTI